MFALLLTVFLSLTQMKSKVISICYEVVDEFIHIHAYYQDLQPNQLERGGIIINGVDTFNFTRKDRNGFYSIEGFKGCSYCYKYERLYYYFVAIIPKINNGWYNITTTNTTEVESPACDFSSIFIDGVDDITLCDSKRKVPEMKCPKNIIVPTIDSQTCKGIIPDLSKQVKTDSCMPKYFQNIQIGSEFYGTKDVILATIDDYKNVRNCTISVFQNSGEFTVDYLKPSQEYLWPADNEMYEITFSGIEFSCPVSKIDCSLAVETNDELEKGVANVEDYEITGELSVKLRARKNKNGLDREYIINVSCSALGQTYSEDVSIFIEKEDDDEEKKEEKRNRRKNRRNHEKNHSLRFLDSKN